jgi:hypothetical protein
MTPADRMRQAADNSVRSWPTLPADFRGEVAEEAFVDPCRDVAILRLRGVDHAFEDVFAACDAAVAMGVPLSRVRVGRFPMPPIVLAESPALINS